jgi:hypothetical protein
MRFGSTRREATLYGRNRIDTRALSDVLCAFAYRSDSAVGRPAAQAAVEPLRVSP